MAAADPTATARARPDWARRARRSRRRPGTSEDRDVDGEEARAEGADEPGPPGARRLEGQHEVEPDHDQGRGGGRARLQQAEIEDVHRDQVRGRHAEAGRDARGHREPADLPQEALGAPRAVARGEREEERRDPDRQRADDREVPWQQRVLDRRDPDRHDQEGGKHGLRDEELGHALDVPEDPAALGDHAGNRGEVAVDEHDVGDRRGHLRARALRDREARRLQRRHIVDAVSHHRHVTAAAQKRLDDTTFAFR